MDGLEQKPLSLPIWLALPEEIQVACAVCKPLDISPAVPPYLFPAPPTKQRVHPPLCSAEACVASGLGRWFALPVSALQWQHARTFHAGSQGDEGCPQAICSEVPRTSPHPLPIPTHAQASALQWITALPSGTSPFCCGIWIPSICDNYREEEEQLKNHSKIQGHT